VIRGGHFSRQFAGSALASGLSSLHLDRTRPSTLRFWTHRNFRDGDRHIIVTFTFEEITHLRLEGFSRQNVIDGLELRRVSVQHVRILPGIPSLTGEDFGRPRATLS
jgi:hypothetical protein